MCMPYLFMGQAGMKYNSKYGLYRILNVAVGPLFPVSLNLKIDGGLINWATCNVKKLQYVTNS